MRKCFVIIGKTRKILFIMDFIGKKKKKSDFHFTENENMKRCVPQAHSQAAKK